MDKQGASASSVRQEQNEGGPNVNRQIQAHPRKARRNVAGHTSPNARGAQVGLAQNDGREVGKTVLWEFRCEALGMKGWTKRIGPADVFRAARAMAEAIDHDEARVMAFGAKKFILEMRAYGAGQIQRIEIGGYPVYKYFANRVE